MGTIRKIPEGYLISFDFDRQLTYRVRSAGGKMVTKKEWFIEAGQKAEYLVQELLEMGEFTNLNEITPEEVGIMPEMPELTFPVDLKVSPYDFQRSGIAYAVEKKRVLIGDEPGLGKTIQAIAAVKTLNAFPCLVICPSSLKINWKEEWEKFTDEKAEVLTDGIKNTWPYFYDAGLVKVFITNYESLKKYFVKDITTPKGGKMKLSDIIFTGNIQYFKSIIVDESHRVKEPKTMQSKLVKGIASGKKVIYLLSGTPVVNKEKDLISQLAILDRIGDFGGLKNFKDRYVGAKYYRELSYKLRSNCYFSRKKSDVLTQLPAKVRQIVKCDIATGKEYEDALADLANYLVQYKNATDEQVRKSLKGEVMVRIGVLKNISARGKIADVVDYVQDIIESGEKIIIFCHLHEVADALLGAFPGALHILGGDSSQERDYAVKSFQNDPDKKVIICSIKAAGVGLTLTASSRVAFIELPWHPADCIQCEDRAHRIGQSDSVQAIYFLGKGTIDEWIYEVIQEKWKISEAITGNTDDTEVSVMDSVIELMQQSLKQ